MCDDWEENYEIVPGLMSQPQPLSSRPSYEFRRSNKYDNRNQRPGGNRGHLNRSEKCETMKIPNKYVGRVIGRGGSKVQELQSESGARIQVTKEADWEETVVKIFGDDNTIPAARKLIEDLTKEEVKVVEPPKPPSPPPKKRPPIEDWEAYLRECKAAEEAEWAKYPEIVKEFYQEHPEVTEMTREQVGIFRQENNNIVVDRPYKKEDSGPIPKPCPKFYHAFHQYPDVLELIEKAAFEKPSPIQTQAWPILLSGQDLIGIAQTGTGKTLAFLLPAMIHIEGQRGRREDRGGPAVLVVAPTRELAIQIDKEVKKYHYHGITSTCVYGGVNREDQVKVVTKGVDIVIATPGRLNDLVSAGHLNVKSVTYVVLDEADRMLDMGFDPQIRKILYLIRPTRQTVMTSATWPTPVRRLASSYMKDPIQVYIGSLDLAATHTVTQVVQIMPNDDDVKLETLIEFARNLAPDEKIIVFCGTKARAVNVSVELCLKRVDCQAIHGDRDQADREQALIDIMDGTVQILIATDVASRGLDIDDVTHVVNYDFPRNIEEYVHRVGRTGRAGKFGESISYFTGADWTQARDLINILEEAQQFVPEELYEMAERFEHWREKKKRGNPSRRGRERSRHGDFGRWM